MYNKIKQKNQGHCAWGKKKEKKKEKAWQARPPLQQHEKQIVTSQWEGTISATKQPSSRLCVNLSGLCLFILDLTSWWTDMDFGLQIPPGS